MSARVYVFPSTGEDRGTVDVMIHEHGGFEVAHESRSGTSWGGMYGPFDRGRDAILVAQAVNREDYGGACDLHVCDAAIEDCQPVTVSSRVVF